jgi:hypothetical protein
MFDPLAILPRKLGDRRPIIALDPIRLDPTVGFWFEGPISIAPLRNNRWFFVYEVVLDFVVSRVENVRYLHYGKRRRIILREKLCCATTQLRAKH